MSPLFFVLPCLLASVLCGYYVGTMTRTSKEQQKAKDQQNLAMKVLSGVVTATEQVATNVDHYNTEMLEMSHAINDLSLDGELRDLQNTLVEQISAVVQTNQQLEDDLNCTRLRLEEQAQLIDEVRREARIDPLSGVWNRKAFDEKLLLLLSMWRREQQPFTLILIDVDHFKWINDSHGHHAGDRVVENLGDCLRSCVGERNFAGRYGGDEFALLIVDTDDAAATAITERIRNEISKRNFNLGEGTEETAITLSIGIASVWEGATAEKLFERADHALYKSKASGRNAVTCYEEAPAAAAASGA